ncbi:MAG: ribonuclease HI family protein [Endomicrobiia bacterium]
MKFKLFFDGNKTPKATTCSYVLSSQDNKILFEETLILPQEITVPQAEYQGLIKGINKTIEYLKVSGFNLKEIELEIYGDSQLVIKQINGEYECKDPKLRILRSEVRNLLTNFLSTNFCWIPRKQNLAK